MKRHQYIALALTFTMAAGTGIGIGAPGAAASEQPDATLTVPAGDEGIVRIDDRKRSGYIRTDVDPQGRPSVTTATDVRVETADGRIIVEGSNGRVVVDALPGDEEVRPGWSNSHTTTYKVTSNGDAAPAPVESPTSPDEEPPVKTTAESVLEVPTDSEGIVRVDNRKEADHIHMTVDKKDRPNVTVGSGVRVMTRDGQQIVGGRHGLVVVDVIDADEAWREGWSNGHTVAYKVSAAEVGSSSAPTTTAPPTTTTTTTTTTAPPPEPSGSDQDPSGTAIFPPRHATTYPMTGSGRAGFISSCKYVNSQAVDPIVFPGSRTKSHEHDFFGNRSTDENTTTDSLINAGTTSCRHADDLSAYWTPSAFDGGQKASVRGTSMYYFTDKVDQASMKSIPVGLRMIAGSANATGPQPDHVTWFEENQNAGNNTRGSSQMITANQSGRVTVRVNFPQCWDGTRLDSPDHKSHMAYASRGIGGTCPSSHPVLLPQLTMFIQYEANGGSDFELSSGPWYTAHADFWNAWHPDTLQEIVDTCRYEHCDRISS